MRSLLQAGSTLFVVTLGVMPSLLKPFCKAGHVRVFKVGVIFSWTTYKFWPTE